MDYKKFTKQEIFEMFPESSFWVCVKDGIGREKIGNNIIEFHRIVDGMVRCIVVVREIWYQSYNKNNNTYSFHTTGFYNKPHYQPCDGGAKNVIW